MHKKINITLALTACLALLASLALAQEFNYEQKMLNKEIKKDLKVSAVLYVPETPVVIKDSPFNPPPPEEKKDKDLNINLKVKLGDEEAIKRQHDDKLATGLLTDRLSATGKLILSERKDINALIREIDFEHSKWASKDQADKLSNIYGVNYIIIADVLRNETQSKVAYSSYTVALRMCDVATAVVAATGSGSGATIEEAIDSAVAAFSENLKNAAWNCRIVKVEGDIVYLNAGQAEGLEKRMALGVYKNKGKITDPVTKKTLAMDRTKIGKIEITELVDTNLSKAKILEKSEPITTDCIAQAKASTSMEKEEIAKWNEIFGNSTNADTITP